MAINLQSPGVLVKEIDATSVVPSVATSDAGFAAAFLWGPADQITTITSEVELVKIFGKPTTTAVEKNWHVASNFLAYAGSLNVVRTLGDNEKNAVDGNSVTGSGTVAEINIGAIGSIDSVSAGGSDYTTATGLATTVSPAGGTGATVDIVANAAQTITSATINAAGQGYKAGDVLTITQSGASGGQVIVGDISSYTLGTTTVTPDSAWGGNQTDVTASQTGAAVPAGGTGLQVKITTPAGGATVTVNSIVAAGTGYSAGDVVSIVDPSGGTEIIKIIVETVSATGSVVIANADDFDANDGGSTNSSAGTASFASRYAGALGNSIQVRLFHQTGTLSSWNGTYTQNGISTTVDFGGLFDSAPDTSSHVLNKNGGIDVNDEIHIVVVDKDGKLSGTAGAVLERYVALSLATDARDAQGNSNYWKDVLRRDSQYIYGTGQWDNVTTAWEGKDSTNTTPFTAQAAQSVNLAGGADDSADGNSFSNRTAAGKGYNLFDDVDTSDISLLLTGVDESSSSDQTAQLAEALIVIAGNRKDCVVTMSPNSGAVIGNAISSTKAGDVETWADGLTSTSYGIADSGWKRTYNRYTDKYVDIPLNGDIAGLMVATDNSNASWWSPAGFSRGQIKNVVKLWLNPTNADRDKLYKARVNPVVAMPGQGTLLFGDKTLLSKPSAFDRINVRRLFIVLEKSISRAAKSMLFEFNDEFTRASFRNMVEPFLNGIKAQRGIQDYLVVCDTSNNTGDVIDRNEFIGDIFIKPARSINFIQLNFVAVGTGVAFSEVASA